jgi:hypothetical protein
MVNLSLFPSPYNAIALAPITFLLSLLVAYLGIKEPDYGDKTGGMTLQTAFEQEHAYEEYYNELEYAKEYDAVEQDFTRHASMPSLSSE